MGEVRLSLIAVVYAAFRSRRAVDPLTSEDEAREHGWIPAVMGASEEGGAFHARHRLDALEPGDEAIAETAEFTLEGRDQRTARQAYDRVRRSGCTVTARRHEDIPADEVAALVRRADDRRDGEIGITHISLNFAMLRSVFERGSRLGAGPVLRLWRSVLGLFPRWWRIESPYRAIAKYRPIWEPRFMLFEKSADLPRIGLAAGRAEGFLEAPGLPKWPHRSHLGADG